MRAAYRLLLLWLTTAIRVPFRTRPQAHPGWCDPGLCHAFRESDGSTVVIHRSWLLQEPGSLRVELMQWVVTSPWGAVRRDPDRVYVDGLGDGITARQIARLAEAVTRAAMLTAGTR